MTDEQPAPGTPSPHEEAMRPSADLPLPSDLTDGTFDLDGHSVDPVIAHPELPRHATFPAAASWVMYDASNTVYAVVVVTYYITAFLATPERLGGVVPWANTLIGTANFLSMMVAGLVVPIIGSMMDGKRGMPSLIFWTLACVGSTAAISVFASFQLYWFALAAFAFANFAYQISLVPYNTMLAVVAKPGREGLVSGLGVGFGYVGALGAVVGVTSLVGTSDPTAGAATWSFAYAGLLFLVFASPCFFFVKEPGRPKRGPLTKALVKQSFAGTMELLREVRKSRMLLCFYAGNFLVVDALNTILFFFIPYMNNVYGGEVKAELINLPMFLSALYIAGLICGTGIGWLGDRVNLKWLFCAMPLLLAVAISAGLWAKGGTETELWIMQGVVVVIGGCALAGIWTIGRKILVVIAPPHQLGRYFGLYGLTLKVSTLGSLTYGVIADAASHRWALGSLLIYITIGFGFLLFLPSKLERVDAPKPAAA